MRVYVKNTNAKLTGDESGKVKHVIWGDWLDVSETTPPSSSYVVHWKSWNSKTNVVTVVDYKIKKSECQADPLLEMIFLDVGQGDGCIVSVPDGNSHKHIIVDAGPGSNMSRFMRWKTRGLTEGTALHAAIITHSDEDHYGGFQPIFDESAYSFEVVYHNGLVERVAPSNETLFGARASGFCTDIIKDKAALTALLTPPAVRGRKLYPKLMWTALSAPARFGNIVMASTLTGAQVSGKTYLPGFTPSATGQPSIEILGPVPEPSANKLRLREFGEAPNDGKFNAGKTKNGHSVILKMEYANFSAIFGGDLNRPAEDYLLRHYGGIGLDRPLADAVTEARKRFSADLLKCCHHGSADVTDEFLKSVSPFAYVLSSGDEESHVHPRPEILGLLGKMGRGKRPLVLCTEMLRSTPESRSLSPAEDKEIERLMDAVDAAPDSASRKAMRAKVRDFWNRRFKRLVNVYGAINIRTDGKKMIVAFLKEKKATGSPWQTYEFAFGQGVWKGGEVI